MPFLRQHRLGISPEAPRLGGLPNETVRRRNNVARNMIAAVLMMVLLLPSVSADIIIDKEVAQVGDLIHIKILPALQDQTLVIITPTDTYRFIGGIPENAAFIPDTPGTHIVRIIDDNTLVDSASFTVGALSLAQAPAVSVLRVSSEEVRIGQPVHIDAPADVTITIIDGVEEFRYSDAARPVTFIPPRAGILTIIVKYADGRTERATVYVKEVDPFMEEAFAAEPAQSIIVTDDTTVRQTTPALLEERPAVPGTYDVELKDVSTSLKRVTFKGLKYDRTPLRIQDVPAPRGNLPHGIIDAFAIDPSGLEFEAASFTFTALGHALYKCVEYDYANQTCYGENTKIMDLIPGQTYTLELTNQDPLFSQTGYLTNPDFTGSTNGWTTLTEGNVAPAYSYVAADGLQTGVAQITFGTKNRATMGSYYQSFNLTIPTGTTLAGLNVSALWRIPTYTAASPGWVNLSIQNAARTATHCQSTASYNAITAWARLQNATGTPGCALGSFTSDTIYTVRLQCYLQLPNTNGVSVACLWDDVNISAMYNDTTAPVMRNAAETPDPVNHGDPITITVNATDNIAVDAVRIEILGVNYTASKAGGDIYSYGGFSTARAPGVYTYRIFTNDTNGNIAANASSSLNFTIRDVRPPIINLMSPDDDAYTATGRFTAIYNLSDQVGVQNCSLIVNGTVRNSTLNPALAADINLTGTLTVQGLHRWNITCNDTSGNMNTSTTRSITLDSTPPAVRLNTTNGTARNTSLQFAYTPFDAHIAGCSLWTNFTGAWQVNQTDASPGNGAQRLFAPVLPAHGTYLWNVECVDLAGNRASNSTNRTVIFDYMPPDYSAILIQPSSGAVYIPETDYTFNITWTDRGSQVDATLLETDLTGTTTNVTPTRAGQVFTYTFADRPAGTYAYRWYANDSAGNWNATATGSYTIIKAASSVRLLLNSSEENMSAELGDWVNVTGLAIAPGGYIELYQDRMLIAAGQSRVESAVQLNLEKRYNFTLLYNATQNHSESRVTLFADVVDKTPPSVALSSPQQDAVQNANVTFTFTPSDNVEVGNCTVVLDSIRNATKDVSRNTLESITIDSIAEGAHNWTVNCSDTSNNTYTNASVRGFFVDTMPPAVFSLISPASGNASSNLSPTFTWQQTSDATFDRYTILVDNDAGFGSVNYEANISPVTNTSMRFELLDQTTWHWRVIAYDRARNTRQAGTYNYTTDSLSPVILLGLANDTHRSVTSIALDYTVTDFTSIANCSLIIDGQHNQTNAGVATGANSFTIPVAEGVYSWGVTCYDAVGNLGTSITRTFTIDRTSPTTFSTSGPANDTISNDATPTYSWTQTSDPGFANYTVEVSDNESFPYANHTLITTSITQTSITQDPPLTDGTWYWRVIAYDRAGNSLIVHPTYIVDTTPPAAFDLISPASGTEERNSTPAFTWQQTNDPHFANYTLLISDTQSFTHINYSTSTLLKTDTQASMTVAANTLWYWRVLAYDTANNVQNSTSTSTYIADYALPSVTLISPASGTTITSSPLVQFRFNVTDPGAIANCSLSINSTLDKTINSPAKGTALTIPSNLENGAYDWSVSCTDIAGNTNTSTTRTLTVDVRLPVQRLHETSPGAVTFTSPAMINLSLNDSTESSTTVTISGGVLTPLANATYTAKGTGMLIFNSTRVNFSGVFSTTRAGDFFVTWKLVHVNGSGSQVLCQHGDDNIGGVSISSTAKSTYAGTCTIGVGETRLQPMDNITLVVTTMKTGGTTRSLSHYWDGVSWTSSVELPAYVLGILQANFTSAADPMPDEASSYTERCNITCADGTCLNTDVYLQLWNGTAWVDISKTGNTTLNSSQLNPQSLGNVNGTALVDFALSADHHSMNNSLRCYAVSTYSESAGTQKNVSIIDRISPAVTLISPSAGAAFEPQDVTFEYSATDRRLESCSLWGNWSGVWKVNQTHAGVNGSTRSFSAIPLDYGVYKWNVQCSDTAGNSGFAGSNRTLYIAGDLAIDDVDIIFFPVAPVEGEEVMIIANITNRANRSEPSFTVQFWLGDPLAGGTQVGTDQVLRAGPLSSNMTNITWPAQIGTNDIRIIIDPSNSIIESDEMNNEASRDLVISMWQTYYGNVSGNVTLGIDAEDTFLNWEFTERGGNIFIADTDTTNGISFLFLQALGTNTSGEYDAMSADDFIELDQALGTGSYADNVTATYDGTQKQFLIFGRQMDVPVASSSANFTTGILWDSDDSSDSHYDGGDREDVVFITSISDRTQGPHGLVDYEIMIPSKLKDHKGSAGTVNFYYELQ